MVRVFFTEEEVMMEDKTKAWLGTIGIIAGVIVILVMTSCNRHRIDARERCLIETIRDSRDCWGPHS